MMGARSISRSESLDLVCMYIFLADEDDPIAVARSLTSRAGMRFFVSLMNINFVKLWSIPEPINPNIVRCKRQQRGPKGLAGLRRGWTNESASGRPLEGLPSFRTCGGPLRLTSQFRNYGQLKGVFSFHLPTGAYLEHCIVMHYLCPRICSVAFNRDCARELGIIQHQLATLSRNE